MSRVAEVPVPVACNLLHALKAVHFCDAYQTAVSNPKLNPQDVYEAVLGCTPGWVKMLLKIRGIVASLLGLSHEGVSHFQLTPKANYQIGQRVGMFSIQSIEPNELILGDNDKHLDFRVSIYRSSLNGVEMATVSTAVKTHNTIGSLYMLVVKPFSSGHH